MSGTETSVNGDVLYTKQMPATIRVVNTVTLRSDRRVRIVT